MAVRHYKIDHDQVNRIDPLALSPRDFVSEWLVHDWTEMALWSESANRGSMRDWHGKLHGDSGIFLYPTMHCPHAQIFGRWDWSSAFHRRRTARIPRPFIF